jgi:excisionase family DNA binding protein
MGMNARRISDKGAGPIGNRGGARGQAVERLYSPKDVAELLGMSLRWVWYRIQGGEMRTLILGKKARRIPERELQRWIRRNSIAV